MVQLAQQIAAAEMNPPAHIVLVIPITLLVVLAPFWLAQGIRFLFSSDKGAKSHVH